MIFTSFILKVHHVCRPPVAHLVDVYVVVVRGVVDGFEEALKLARGSSMDHQDKCYSDWF